MFDMDTVPKQSQINELIRWFDSDSIQQLGDIHHHFFMEHSNSAHSYTRVVVDCDQTGLIANGKTFELAEKGHFAKKKIKEDTNWLLPLQVKIWNNSNFLDSGDSHCTDHYSELLEAIPYKKSQNLKVSWYICIFMDSIYNTQSHKLV